MPAPLPPLPARPDDGHKGTFGTVCVIGGQAAEPRVMLGGPAFTALGALRAGAGLAVLAMPSPLLAPALVAAPSATGLALPVDSGGALMPSEVAGLLDRHVRGYGCLAVGPGLGADVPQQQIVARITAAAQVPMVLDADALNALAALHEFQGDFHCEAIITPHPGEFRRLADALRIDADPVDPDTRPGAASQLAQRLGCIVVLKGAATVTTDGLETIVNTTGNAALGTAGTGDVLAGVIAALVAQFHPRATGRGGGLSLLHCAAVGVHLHGAAADLWARRHGDAGMLATDLLDRLPDAIQAYRRERTEAGSGR